MSSPSIVALYRSAGHNFVGHHGREPGTYPMESVSRVELRAGWGIVGDRFFGYRPDFKGQVTFFALETHLALGRALGVNPDPGVYRRNVITRDVDLNGWIGREFEFAGVRFRGIEECRPCHWMDRAVTPGAEVWVRGQGGLRAMVLTDGWLEAVG